MVSAIPRKLRSASRTLDVVNDRESVVAVDVTCLVLHSFKTPRKTFSRALKALGGIHCEPAGVVLNFLPSGLGTYDCCSGRYYGSYGEKGVYGT